MSMKDLIISMMLEHLEEKAANPYAIGMAAAMKATGDEPPLKKSTITKAHKIAKGIEKNEEVELDEAMTDDDWVHINRAGSFHSPQKDKIVGYSKSSKDPNRAPKLKVGANSALRVGDAKKKGYVIEEVEQFDEQVAWSHKTYDDYVAHNKAKGLQVIPKDLWTRLKKNPDVPSK